MLAILGQCAVFNAKDLSEKLRSHLIQAGDVEGYALLERQFSTKRISGDLDRLYRMGFLNRKRVKRVVYPKGSIPCVRGFSYDYRISKQGWQYLDYLAKPRKEQTSIIDNLLRKVITNDLNKRMPKPFVDLMEEGLFGSGHQDKGRHNRFPKRKDRI
jgi:hypothetical protein